jgi:hypothetical protein
MRQRIGMLIDEELIKLAKRRAAEEGRPLNDLIQDALISYLKRNVSNPHQREAGYRLFCERPFRLSSAQFQRVLATDTCES